METAFIPVTGPFNLSETLYCGQAFRWQPVGDWHYGVIYGNLVRVRQTLLGLEWESQITLAPELPDVIRRYFRLDDDLSHVYERIGIDERLRGAINLYYGMRLLEQEPWECLISYLLSINSNIPRMSALVEMLSNRLGAPVSLDGETRHTFPGPYALADLGETGLRLMGVGFRAPFVAGAAQAVASGRLDLADLRELPYEEAKEELVKLPGVGDKVADCVLLFSQGKLEAFPVDRWVRRAVTEWYFPGRRINDKEIHRWAWEQFGPYAGYAQQYLFHGRRQNMDVIPSSDLSGRGI